ncbi:hypothetical protein CVT25_015133 [Psilocybe cyanescens]|uniref:Uncharacterized protein n=1 Tax=Psilocybe cyanescens TaxID=93625 RepID=A0A409WR60_PSICY|nr:hypothetical protein CVT25_015133 [Psilocybe cyanescens]
MSFGPVIVLSKTSSTSGVSQHPNTHEARGSFIPLRSAASTLKSFAPHPTTLLSPTRRRRVTFAFDDRRLSAPKFDDDSDESSPPSPQIPYITRTLSSSPFFSASPTSSSSSSIQEPHHATTDLHPILASLERKRRLSSLCKVWGHVVFKVLPLGGWKAAYLFYN